MSASGSSSNLLGNPSARSGLLPPFGRNNDRHPVSHVEAAVVEGMLDWEKLVAVPVENLRGLPVATVEARTSRGEAAAAGITCDPATVVEAMREWEKLLTEAAPVENLRGLPAATAEARTGRGDPAAAGITWDPAAVVEGELEWERLLTQAVPVENLPGLAGRIGIESAFEKGKTVVPVIGESATMKKRKVESLVRNLGERPESSRRLGPVASRLAHKVAPVLEEVPNGENIVTVAYLLEIMVRRNHGEPISSQTIHEANVYSKPPKELVQEFAAGGRTLWMDKLQKRKIVSLFIDRYGGKGRSRMVGGSGGIENGKWHGDHKAVPVEGFPWASKTQYYYRINCNKAKPRGDWTGWCMTEFSLMNQEEGTYMVCMVYQSNRSHPETTIAGSRPPGAETPTIEQGQDEAEDGASVDASLGSPGAGSDTGLAWMANLLLQAAEKAKRCSDFKRACEINEFVDVKDLLEWTIDKLGLDRFIISELLDALKIRLQHVAMNKELPPKERDVIVSYGEYMWKTIYSAHFDECVRQAGFFSKVQGAENELHPSPVNSSPGASSSSVKRKGNHDHLEAPPSVRQDLTYKDREQLTEDESFLLFDNNLAAGASHSVHQAAIYAGIFNVDGSVVQAEQQGLAEAAEGGNRLGTEEEVTGNLPAECRSPGELLDLPIGDGLLDMPISDGLLDMFMGDELLDMTTGDISYAETAFAFCASGLHVAADCHCALPMTDESVAFDTWLEVNDGSLPDC